MTDDKMSMAWNESGDNNNRKDPWSKRNDGPPDLDQVLKKIQENLSGLFGGKKGSSGSDNNKGMITVISMVLLLLYGAAGFYIVKPAEQAVVTRFGEYNRTVGQGPHWVPTFIESKRVINTEKLERSSHGSSMLTKDENIVTVGIEVQYRISAVEKYLFKLVAPSLALKEAADSALRQIIGNSSLDFIVTSGKEQIASAIHEQLQETLDSYDVGIYVAAVALKEAKVPADVKSAFDDVIKAQEEREQLKHQAEAFANKIIPEAKGTAVQMVEEAKAYKQEVILAAEGDTIKFKLVLNEYNKAPEVTRTRLYLDTVEEILSKTSKILIDVDSGNNLLYLPVDKLLGDSKLNQENVANIEKKLAEEASQLTLPSYDENAGSKYDRRRRRG